MPELNMNDIIHAAVRRDLGRIEGALRTFSEGDRARAGALQRAWETLWRQLHHHHVGEDSHVWPYLRSLGVLDERMLEEMEHEHEAMAAAMTAATAGMAAFADAPTTSNAVQAADLVARAHEITEQHLVHEETAVIPFIEERWDTPEWKATEKQLRKGSPSHNGEFFAWLQDGATPEILAGLRANIPAPVVFVLSRVFGRRYAREVAPVWR
ncbi:hemerythrin domain-containing protein [Nocardioides jensenii]|uniref:hemerythrin domain-containing protein n=1 Tax=Nocardioides jensenii TaxID=1843 RepID=UPI000B04C6AC|nr:hemerythrin domain-containing protein [Nocardioides jensenii]